MKTFIIFLLAAALYGQDTRKVTEPSIPSACTTLTAKIGRAGTSIALEDEEKPDTRRIQAAIDQCAAGQSVVLRRASARLDAFLSGPLTLRKGVTLVVDKGAFLFASRNPRDYDLKPGVCGTIDQSGRACKPLLNGDGVADAGVMGDGVIDGRGGETMLGQNVTWWNLADRARQGGTQNNPRILVLNHCDNFTLYRITLRNSPNFHVAYNHGNGFTVWGVKVWSPERARNTDGIDPGNSTNVTIAYSYFHTGDDQVAIKAGKGEPTTHFSILHNHFYTGHGMSIGSETQGGASAILISDLSIDGADNGIRIKSNSTRGGLVRDVTFQDVCIRDTENPIYMDTTYAHVTTDTGHIPMFEDIVIRDVRVIGGGKVTLEGYDATHKLGIQFDNVVFDDPSRIKLIAKDVDVKTAPGALPLKIAGNHVKVREEMTGKSVPNACTGKFVDFPERY